MKNLHFIPALLLLCTPALCQQSKLRGQIAVQNSRFDKNGKGEIEYVPFAEVDECSQPRKGHSLSDAQGQWAMEVVGIADKNPVFLKVSKEGWLVVNADALQATAGQTAPVRLFMATNKYITDAKRRYYNTGYTEAEKNLNLKITAKQKEMDALRLQTGYSEQVLRKLQEEYGLLQSQYEKLDALARELSEKYARINLDDAGQLYQDAFRLFQAGDLDGAMHLWQNANLSKQVKDNLEEGRRLGALKKEISERNPIYLRNKEDLMQNLRLKADVYRLRLQWDSVELTYEDLIRLDTADLDNIWTFSEFLWNQNKINKGIFYGKKALNLARSESDEATLSMNLGNFYYTNQKIGEAEKMYLRSLDINKRLAKANPAQFEPDLARIAMNLGGFYSTSQKMEEAEKIYLRSLEIYERLAKANPAQFEPNLAAMAMNFGVFYAEIQKMEKAEKMYLRSLDIWERLAKANPAQFEPNLAATAINLGVFYVDIQKMEEAEKMYLRSLDICERLAKANSAQFEPKLALVAMNLGVFYSKVQKMGEAEKMHLCSFNIYERLAKANPAQFELNLARTAMNLGLFYAIVQKMGESEKMYLRSLDIYERLAEANPVQFEPDLARTAMNLGNFYANVQKMGEAEKMYLRSFNIRERLAKASPAQFEPDLAMTAMNLGLFYYTNKKMGEAEKMYLRSFNIRERLVKANPAQFEPDMALMALNLGLFYYTNQKMAEAKKMYLRSLDIYERLAKANPAQFEPDLANALNSFGAFHEKQSLLEKAHELYSRALALRQKAVASGQTYIWPELNGVYSNMADLRDSFELKKDHASASAIQRERAECMYALKSISIEVKLEAVKAYNDLYLLCYSSHDFQQAAEAAEKVLDLAPARNWVRPNLGHSYLLANDWPKAKAVYQEYLKNETDPAEAKKDLAKDWDDLEAAGITCREMAKARAWAKE